MRPLSEIIDQAELGIATPSERKRLCLCLERAMEVVQSHLGYDRDRIIEWLDNDTQDWTDRCPEKAYG